MWKGLALAVVVAAAAGVAAGWGRMSQTWDEPAHLAAGLEWLQDGTGYLWTENPPLARVAGALGPFLSGARLPLSARDARGVEADGWVAYQLGNQALWETGRYEERLALARSGILPFYLAAALALWLMVRPAGPAAAFLAVAAFASLPGVLAMAGLATTDMGFCAMYLVFILRLRAWLDEPDRRNVLTLGLSIGAVTATKFWSLLLVPVAFLAFGAAHEWDRRRSAPRTDAWLGRLRTLPAAALAAALSLWAIYAFSWGRIGDFPRWVLDLPILGPHAGPLNAAASRLFAQTPVPAPGFWHGLLMLLAHNRAGHAAYALGIESQTGFWYFFPLALLIKTPLPFLILCVLGATIAMWKPRAAPWWVIGAFASIPLVLTALMFSRVNTGLRNVLVIYGLAAIGTAGALGTMAIRLGERERKALATAVAVLGLWQGVITVRSWPDWMTYFNPIAADDPGAYLVDADFDWGQGVTQLEAYFRDHPLPDGEPLWIAYFGSADLRRFALPPLRALPPRTHVSGWIAISERRYRETRSYGWLRDAVPVATVARVIRIYRIP